MEVEISVRKRTIYLTIFIAFSLHLAACGSSQMDNEYPLQKVMAQPEAEFQKTIEQKATGQENIGQENTPKILCLCSVLLVFPRFCQIKYLESLASCVAYRIGRSSATLS